MPDFSVHETCFPVRIIFLDSSPQPPHSEFVWNSFQDFLLESPQCFSGCSSGSCFQDSTTIHHHSPANKEIIINKQGRAQIDTRWC
ncbi:hypothetical protein ATANTOWER_013291 [Ataeniobius toweri]|uniref:Uncharacterized protein n=1 Tax=Ataeniobius toweri TaxID=208326 RepID=A0ABU7AP08_9TELE|nr:hypothetical protein [Ataeniobius toweri]